MSESDVKREVDEAKAPANAPGFFDSEGDPVSPGNWLVVSCGDVGWCKALSVIDGETMLLVESDGRSPLKTPLFRLSYVPSEDVRRMTRVPWDAVPRSIRDGLEELFAKL